MTNKSILTDYNYNLSKVISPDIIENPPRWLANFNSFLGGYFIVTMLSVFMILLFLIMRRREDVNDVIAFTYASYLTSILGMLLFVITTISGVKLLTFEQYTPFLVLTGISILIQFIIRRYLE